MFAAAIAVAGLASAQNADDYRGGWRTDSREAHVYEFSIRGTTVRGVYCTYCADATTLALSSANAGSFLPIHGLASSTTGAGGRAASRSSTMDIV